MRVVKVKTPYSWEEIALLAEMYGSVRVEIGGKVYLLSPTLESGGA